MKNQEGFTLVELLIALVISLFVLAAVGSIYSYFLGIWDQANSSLELQRDGSFAIEEMAKKIRNGSEFTIDDYGTGTDNKIIIVTNATSTGLIGFYQDTADDPVSLKNDNGTPYDPTDDVAIFPPKIKDAPLYPQYSVKKLEFKELDSSCVRIDLKLKCQRKDDEDIAIFTSTVQLRNY
jgi:prepilin-type N-terminal cleavage/methylation domain-containing protein